MAKRADSEKGFHLMNSIKSKQRNRMGDVHLNMIVRIKSYLQSNCVYKDRKEKQNACTHQ